MDYETFGEHQWKGYWYILTLCARYSAQVLANSDYKFATPSETMAAHSPVAALSMINPVSWADQERDLSAWLGNDLQDDACFRRNLYFNWKIKYQDVRRWKP